MVYIYNKATSDLIGEIGEDDLQFLIDQMEEESMKDQDYSITNMEISYFAENGASSGLIELLRKALGDQPEVIILWSQTPI
ncbi:MAG: galactosyldiacylglycerol synthase [Chloroflexota bacterium]|nr:MAG: galactosyldiacylglycerol synthase [Chloroflexota bacterium]UCF28298.1 MAG: galactosyldiacylglycerol synthase [Chloroflexota bacterium]